MELVLAAVTTTVVGVMVGLELAVALVLNPILLRLPVGPSIAGRADGARMLGRTMPVWYIASLVLTTLFAVATWGEPAATPTLIAAALLMLSVILSVVLLVPINSRTKTWTVEDHPVDWRDQMRRWDRLHIVRVVVIVVAFAFVASATTLQ